MPNSTARRLRTGSTPGIPWHTGHVWLFGRAPNVVGHPQNIFELVRSWAWTSRPMTTSIVARSVSPAFTEGGLPRVRCGSVRSCQARPPRAPRRRLLVRVCGTQDAGLVERLADELETDRESLHAEPARYRDCGEPRHVRRDGEDVVQVHRERVFFLPVLEGDVRCHRRDNQVHATKRGVEVAAHERPHPLGAPVG